VLGGFTIVDAIKKNIEQVGSAYEKLKVKFAKQLQKTIDTQKKRDANPHHESSADEASEEEKEEVVEGAGENKDEWEKKRHRRTKEDIEREVLLMGDLYAILGLEHL